MADKIVIEIYKTKAPDEFTKALAAPDSRLEIGSAAASTAASSAALLARAAALTAAETDGNERVDYILRNAETLRTYMVHLIDEDVKSRGPLAKAMKEGDARNIEAARQPAACISAEIVNMMGQCLDLMAELAALCPKRALHYLGEGAELAMAAIRACMIYLVDMANQCSDETYRFVIRRENELTLENCTAAYDRVIARVKEAV